MIQHRTATTGDPTRQKDAVIYELQVWRDIISGGCVAGGDDIAVGDALQSLPVAVLVQQTRCAVT